MGTTKFFSFITLFISSIILLQHPLNAQDYSWEPVGPGGGSDLITITIHPQNPDHVLIGGDIEGIFRTDNGGDTWSSINNNMVGTGYGNDVYWVQDIVFDPDNSDIIYNSNLIGVFKSENSGASWERIFPQTIESEDDYISIASLAIPEDDNSTLFAGAGVIVIGEEDGNGSLYRSSDGGTSWESLDVPIGSETAVYNIFIDPRTSGATREIYINTDEGVFKSPDNGDSWNAINTGLPHLEGRELKGFVLDDELHLYASLITYYDPGADTSFKGGLFYSSDEGANWIDITGDLPKYDAEYELPYDYRHFAVNYSDPNVVYTSPSRYSGYERWGIYKTTNGGSSWHLIDSPPTDSWLNEDFFDERYAHVMATAPSDSNIVYIGLDWIRKTEDAGQSWIMKNHADINEDGYQTNGLELMNVDDIAFDPNNENILYVGYDDNGLFKSVDGGDHYLPMDETQDPFDGYDGVKDIIIKKESGNIFVSRNGGSQEAINSWFALGQVWKSTDGGSTFEKKSNGLPDGRPQLVSNPLDENIIYNASFHNGIYKTTDGAENWTEISTGLGDDKTNIWSLAMSQSNDNILFAGSVTFGEGGKLFKTTDAGENWAQLANFPNLDILTIKVDPDDENTIYVGAADNWEWAWTGGFYKSTDGGDTWNEILSEKRIVDVAVNPNNTDEIYALSQSFYRYDPEREVGIHKSMDGGETWEVISEEIQHKFLNFVKMAPGEEGVLYAGSSGGGLWKGTPQVNSSIEDEIVDGFELYQNYPNPFNPVTTIKYDINTAGLVKLRLYNVLGAEVLRLVEEIKPAGSHHVQLDASNLSSGIYFYRIETSDFIATKRLALIK